MTRVNGTAPTVHAGQSTVDGATIDHVEGGDRLASANAVRANRAARRAALEAARRLRALDDEWLRSLAVAVEAEIERRAGAR